MKHQYDFAVFIGRFQPYHLGHERIVLEALDSADKVIILVGSSHRPRTTRNPFTFEERKAMIEGSLTADERKRVVIAPIVDVEYNNELWLEGVHRAVMDAGYKRDEHSIALIGHSKDSSSFYLNHFPSWKAIQIANFKGLSATDIRAMLFAPVMTPEAVSNGFRPIGRPIWEPIFRDARKLIPNATAEVIHAVAQKKDANGLWKEARWVQAFKAPFEQLARAPVFVMVHAVVIQSGHVLMERRSDMPGKGLLALPGGLVGQEETLEETVVRELRDEVGLKVPAEALKNDVRSAKRYQFDSPHRSVQGRTLATAFRFDLRDAERLPKIRGRQAGEKADWMPLAELDTREIFEDHYAIIRKMLSM